MITQGKYVYGSRNRNKKKIEPLKKFPDYSDQRKRGSLINRQAAINLDRVYFVDEDLNRLIVSAEEIKRGGEPTRFTGQLPYIPEKGDILSNSDFSEMFEVVKRILVPTLSVNVPPKIYVVLKGM